MRNTFHKAIPERRDRLQSRLLVGIVAAALLLSALLATFFLWTAATAAGLELRPFLLKSLALSIAFALIVWRLRAGTPAAAAIGALLCLLITCSGFRDAAGSTLRTGLSPLITLFLLTFASTRAGRAVKARAGLAESRKGRSAAQVVANLGTAGLVAAVSLVASPGLVAALPSANLRLWPILLLAALAEATADTVSSEIGQAFGGSPILLTTLRRVAPGTDGAITPRGTSAGLAAAALVALAGQWALHLTRQQTLIALAAATAGLFFDSLLGATLERRGWLGNDLVNFTSTLFAAAAALAFLSLPGTLHR